MQPFERFSGEVRVGMGNSLALHHIYYGKPLL